VFPRGDRNGGRGGRDGGRGDRDGGLRDGVDGRSDRGEGGECGGASTAEYAAASSVEAATCCTVPLEGRGLARTPASHAPRFAARNAWEVMMRTEATKAACHWLG
jgi:hypothetical protein